MDPAKLYDEYGTHLLVSVTVGGRALFLTSTDTRTYSSEVSIEAAAKASATYLIASVSGEVSVENKEKTKSFNESSETVIYTSEFNLEAVTTVY